VYNSPVSKDAESWVDYQEARRSPLPFSKGFTTQAFRRGVFCIGDHWVLHVHLGQWTGINCLCCRQPKRAVSSNQIILGISLDDLEKYVLQYRQDLVG
jgi:hypothetical protein